MNLAKGRLTMNPTPAKDWMAHIEGHFKEVESPVAEFRTAYACILIKDINDIRLGKRGELEVRRGKRWDQVISPCGGWGCSIRLGHLAKVIINN